MKSVLYAVVSLCLAACGAGDEKNMPPQAVISVSDAAQLGAPVQLNGADSSDPEHRRLAYHWSITQLPTGSHAELNSQTVVNPSFTPDVPGDYEVALRVDDGRFLSNSTRLIVTVKQPNRAPQAVIDTLPVATRGSTVALDASQSSDADGDALSYTWAFLSLPSGSSAACVPADSKAASFVADIPGTYRVRLRVSDGELLHETVTDVEVYEGNAPPVAVVDGDKAVTTATPAALAGDRSYDLNGDAIAYTWSVVGRPAGSAAALTAATSSVAWLTPDLAGDYEIRLIVTDRHGVMSAPASLTVRYAPADTRPLAKATSPGRVVAGDAVQFDGLASFDADGDPLTFAWTLITLPAGSAATLNLLNAANPSMKTDVAGTYIVSLTVSDGVLTSAPVTVAVEAFNANGFSRPSNAPVLTASALDGNTARAPFVLYDEAATAGSKMKMWYTGVSGGKPAIYYAQSDTGGSWAGSQLVLAAGAGTIANGTRAPSVISDATSGRWKMWFTGIDGANRRTIHYAESTDGLTWTGIVRVLNDGTGGGFDALGDMDPQVRLENGIYKMWFAGIDGNVNPAAGVVEIGYTRSGDGKTWLTPQRVVRRGRWANGLDNQRVWAPTVAYEGGVYKMWYGASDGTFETIGYADSSDGVAWNTYNSINPVLFPATPDEVGGIDEPAYLRVGGEIYLWYAGRNGGGIWNIFLARP